MSNLLGLLIFIDIWVNFYVIANNNSRTHGLPVGHHNNELHGIRTYLKTHRFHRLCFLAETGEQRTNAQIDFLTETSKTRIRKRAGIERMSPYFERRKEVTKSLPIFLEALGFFLSDRDHASVLGRSEIFQFHLAFVKAT